MPRMPRNRKEVVEIDKKSFENGNSQMKDVGMRRLETRSRREGRGLRV